MQSLIDDGSIVNIIGLFETNGMQVALAVSRFQWDTTTNSLRIDLTADGFGGSSETLLFDGNYQLQLDVNPIRNTNDQPLRDTDGTDDGIYRFDFHRLDGDLDGDGLQSQEELDAAFAQL